MSGPAITLRRLTRSDFPLLARWLAEPHVARRWVHQTTPDNPVDDERHLVYRLDRSACAVVSRCNNP